MFSTLLETKRQLEIGIGQVFDTELDSSVFSVLIDFLARFIHIPDFCSLERVIEAQMQRLFEEVFVIQGNQKQDSNPQWRQCFNHISKSYVQLHKKAMLPQIESLLTDVALLVDSLNTFREMVQVVRDHSLSPTCIAATMRLKYCAYCVGNTEFKPCIFLCVNTFRGCLADIAELYPSYTAFVAILRTFSLRLSSELQPELLVSRSMSQFISLARDLSRSSLKERVRPEMTV